MTESHRAPERATITVTTVGDSGAAGRRRAHSAPKRRGRPPRRHTVAKVLTTTTLVMALAVAMSVVYLYRHLNSNLTVDDSTELMTNRPEVIKVEGPREPINILVMGSDSREGKGNNIDGLTGLGERSDTTILVHLSADRTRAYGISIPRDSMIARPECKLRNGDVVPGSSYAMWNEAFGIGGAACTMQQFEQLTGIRLQHHVVIDFQGFKDMVDAIDGVEVCLPEPIDDPEHNIHLKAGTRQIKGNEALSYVRVRYRVGDGSDTSRVKRQQAFIASMANKVISADTLARPDRTVKFLNAATKSLTVDRGLKNVLKIADVAVQFKDIGLDRIQFITVPWGTDPTNPNRIVWTPAAADLWKRIANDRPLTKSLKTGVIKASEQGSGSPSSPSSEPTRGPSASPSATPGDSAKAEEALRNGLCA